MLSRSGWASALRKGILGWCILRFVASQASSVGCGCAVPPSTMLLLATMLLVTAVLLPGSQGAVKLSMALSEWYNYTNMIQNCHRGMRARWLNNQWIRHLIFRHLYPMINWARLIVMCFCFCRCHRLHAERSLVDVKAQLPCQGATSMDIRLDQFISNHSCRPSLINWKRHKLCGPQIRHRLCWCGWKILGTRAHNCSHTHASFCSDETEDVPESEACQNLW